jgi:hypothetical protein
MWDIPADNGHTGYIPAIPHNWAAQALSPADQGSSVAAERSSGYLDREYPEMVGGKWDH